MRSNGRLPAQGTEGEERTLANFLNRQQQWMAGRGWTACRGAPYPAAKRRLLQTVPKLSARIRHWDALKAQRKRAAAKPKASESSQRRELEERFCTESKLAKTKGLPTLGSATTKASRYSAAFVETILKAPAAYPHWARKLLKEVTGASA